MIGDGFTSDCRVKCLLVQKFWFSLAQYGEKIFQEKTGKTKGILYQVDRSEGPQKELGHQ